MTAMTIAGYSFFVNEPSVHAQFVFSVLDGLREFELGNKPPRLTALHCLDYQFDGILDAKIGSIRRETPL